MFQQTADKAPATFHDVAAYFSDEEWKLLHEWQKDLYRNVMKDIHEALLSLGPLIAASVFSLKAKEQDYIFPSVYENSEGRHSTSPSTRFPFQENNFCLTVDEETSKSIIGQVDAGGESSSCPNSAEEADIASVISFQIKGDGDHLCFDHHKFVRRERHNSSPAVTEHESTVPVVSLQIKEEVVMSPINHRNSDGKERTQDTPGENWTMNRPNEAQNTVTYEVKAAHFQTPEKKANLDDPKSSKKGVHSRDRLWLQNIHEQEIMEIIPWENTFCEPTRVLSQHDSTNVGRSNTHNGANISLSNECLRETEKNQKQTTCTEPTKHISPVKEFTPLKKTHTDERPHTCTYCDKRFSRKGDLNRHLTTHTGEKPYTCSYCQKSFNRKFNLNGHKMTHYQGRRTLRKYTEHSQIENTTNGNP